MSISTDEMRRGVMKMAIRGNNMLMAKTVEKFALLSQKYGRMVASIQLSVENYEKVNVTPLELAAMTVAIYKLEAVNKLVERYSEPYMDAFKPTMEAINANQEYDHDAIPVIEIYCNALISITDDFELKHFDLFKKIDSVYKRFEDAGLVK